MNRISVFILIILTTFVFTSCESNVLDERFDCNGQKGYGGTKEYRDVLKRFTVAIPSTWKTQLYYDEFQSEIYSADTTKELTSSFIIDFVWHQGEVILDSIFATKVDVLLQNEKLKMIDDGYGEFKNFPAYYNYSQGEQLGFDYHYLQLFVKTNVDEYFTISSKVYGLDNINERICESIGIMNTLEIKKD